MVIYIKYILEYLIFYVQWTGWLDMPYLSMYRQCIYIFSHQNYIIVHLWMSEVVPNMILDLCYFDHILFIFKKCLIIVYR